MPQAEKKVTPAAEAGAKAGKAEKTEADKPKVVRTNFSAMYPEDAALKVLVEENPKKKGSKSAARFEGYTGATTVGAALANGVTYQDIAYDVGRAFIQIG